MMHHTNKDDKDNEIKEKYFQYNPQHTCSAGFSHLWQKSVDIINSGRTGPSLYGIPGKKSPLLVLANELTRK